MGECVYCGKPAGLLHRQHQKCRERHDQARSKLPEFFLKELTSDLEPERFEQLVRQIAADNFITPTELKDVCATGLAAMVSAAIEHGVITTGQESRIAKVAAGFGVDSTNPIFAEPARKLKKLAILRDLDNGKIPGGIIVQGSALTRFNLQKNEQMIWLFDDVKMHRMKTNAHYEGGSSGVSVRVAKGLYFRTSAFKGRRVESQSLELDGEGYLAVTTRAVIFLSPFKSLRIETRKIAVIEPYSDGVGLTPTGANPKPLVFALDDPWFAANVIGKINQLE